MMGLGRDKSNLLIDKIVYNETLPAQSLQLGKKSLAMGVISSVVVALLLRDQSLRPMPSTEWEAGRAC